MSISSLQTGSQLDSNGSGLVDIKYEDYSFTCTSMASQNSWCALSQAWAALTGKTDIDTRKIPLALLWPSQHPAIIPHVTGAVEKSDA